MHATNFLLILNLPASKRTANIHSMPVEAFSAVLNDNWNKIRTEIEHHKLCSENPARLLSKGKY